MISFIRKLIFAERTKNSNAPHIFVVLCVYTVIVTAYTGLWFGPREMVLRLLLSLIMVVVYTLFEKSNLSEEVTAFFAPLIMVAVLTFGAIYFHGDFLLFTYSIGIATISLSYLKPRAIAGYIIATNVPLAVILFVFNVNLLGASYSTIHTILFFITSIAINFLIYIYCKFYASALDALTAAKNEAYHAAEAKGTFLSTMSHEIRTPMNAIIGMTNIGLAATDIERKHDALEKIDDASLHLLGIINDILDMAKIEAGKLELSVQDFKFEAMLQRVVSVISIRVAEKKQNFTLNVDDNIPPVLVGDDQRLAQVIANLMGNAIKFTPDGGSIRLDAKLLGEEDGVCTIQIDVVDTGIGISPEQQTNLFKAFQQAEATTSRRFGGTGLGLAISKNIIEMMDGCIGVKSELGKGSTFSFAVRMKRGDADSRAEEDVADNKVDFSGFHLLLAEDVEINREIVLTLLEPTNLEIDIAVNGVEAVQLFCNSPGKYDMIFMDVQMPEMDGYEATRQIRLCDALNAKSVPIIALTANVFREEVAKCMEAGMNGHIGKPLDFSEVMRVLNMYLG